MLSLEGLCCTVGGFSLKDVSLSMAPDEYFVLLGPTGSGKTTLLKCLAGLAAPCRGTITLGGRDLTALDPALRGIGYVPQSYSLFPHLKVRDNILFGLAIRGVSRAVAERRLSETAEILQIGGILPRSIDCLSGGEMQRVALARALIVQPRALLLDEPFSAIDPGLRAQLWLEVKGLLNSLGVLVIHVTHNLVEASATADRLGVLIDGKVEQVGAPDEIFSRPAPESVARYHGIRNIYTGEVAASGDGTVTVQCRGFRIVAPAAALGVGRHVKVCIRPQDLKIIREGYPVREELRANLLTVEVISSYLCNEFYTVLVRCGEEIEMRLPADICERHDLSPGKRIVVGIWQKNIMVFP